MYEWLVIAGANAKFKGTGTIKSKYEYKFMITVIVDDINEADEFETDRFRIKNMGRNRPVSYTHLTLPTN